MFFVPYMFATFCRLQLVSVPYGLHFLIVHGYFQYTVLVDSGLQSFDWVYLCSRDPEVWRMIGLDVLQIFGNAWYLQMHFS